MLCVCIRKLLAETSLLLAVSGTQQDIMDEARQVVLLLTGDMVVVVSQEEDAQQQAFALSQLHCQSPAPAILKLTVTDNPVHNPTQVSPPAILMLIVTDNLVYNQPR